MNNQPHIEQRRKRVTELAAQNLTPRIIQRTLVSEGLTNPQTNNPYSLSTVRNDLRKPMVSGAQTVAEMIGRVVYGYPYNLRRMAFKSIDATQTDYGWWDKLRRGKAPGFEMVGTLADRFNKTTAAYELADGVSSNRGMTMALREAEEETPKDEKRRDHTNRELERFTSDQRAEFLSMEDDKLALGDQYLIVNPDGSLSRPSPETVKPEFDPLDYRKLVKVTITTKLDKATITDEYTAEKRTQKIQYHDTLGLLPVEVEYANLIGEIPVVHFPCDRGSNELFGHPLCEPLFRIFSRYDDLIEKALDGVELMGNPVPVFEGMDDVQATIDANKTLADEDYDDADGQRDSRVVLKFDRLPAIVLGKGGTFKFASPEKGFTTDILNMLEMLFLLSCEYTGIPEFMVGAAVAQSKASTETQLPPFIQHIQMRRAKLTPFFQQLARIWLKTKRLTDPQMVVEDTRVIYPEISLENEQIKLQKMIFLDGKGYVQPETTVESMHVVPDPKKEVALAQERRQDQLEDDFMNRLNAAANQEMDPTERAPGQNRPNRNPIAPRSPNGGRQDYGASNRVGEVVTTLDNRHPTGIDPEVPYANGQKRRRKRRRPQKVFA